MVDKHSNTTIIAQNLFAVCANTHNVFSGDTSIATTSTNIAAKTPIIAQNRNNANAITTLCYANVNTCLAILYKYCLGDTSITTKQC
jgi:hypothetical protein